MVIACDSQYAAVLGSTEGIGMFDHVHTAINTRALAIPHAEHAVVLGTPKKVHLLASPDCGRSQVFIHAGYEFYVVLFEVVGGFPHRLIDPA